MKNRGEKMAYKNVHQKLQKLFSLGLLQEVEHNKRSFHGARFYKVSPKGWFNLLINSSTLLPSSIAPSIEKAVRKYYSKNIIFETASITDHEYPRQIMGQYYLVVIFEEGRPPARSVRYYGEPKILLGMATYYYLLV